MSDSPRCGHSVVEIRKRIRDGSRKDFCFRAKGFGRYQDEFKQSSCHLAQGLRLHRRQQRSGEPGEDGSAAAGEEGIVGDHPVRPMANCGILGNDQILGQRCDYRAWLQRARIAKCLQREAILRVWDGIERLVGVGLVAVGIDQLLWRRQKLQDKEIAGDLTLFNQEYPSRPQVAFMSTGRPVFDVEKIDYLLSKARETPPRFTGSMRVEVS